MFEDLARLCAEASAADVRSWAALVGAGAIVLLGIGVLVGGWLRAGTECSICGQDYRRHREGRCP